MTNNPKTNIQPKKHFDLEERTFNFAKTCRDFVRELPRSKDNEEYGRQLVRSSGSTAANYIEANEAFSTKDFILRLRIARKEAKESRLWLKLVLPGSNTQYATHQSALIQEALELVKILSSIIEKNT